MIEKIKITLRVFSGIFSEWFNFTLIALMLPLIILNFVPQQQNLTQTFILLVTYSSILLTRPFGSLIFSHFSDHFGRKKTAVLTQVLMGFSMLFLSLCPSLPVIGVAAPAFLLLCIFLHGFSSGGEWANTVVFSNELRHDKNWGLAGFVMVMLTFKAIFLANILSALILMKSSQNFSETFAWRILFFIAAIFAFLGVRERLKLKETLKDHSHVSKFKLFKTIRSLKKPITIGSLIAACDGIVLYFFIAFFFPIGSSQLNQEISFISSTIAIVFGFFLYLLSKKLSAVSCLKISNFALILLGFIQLFIDTSFAFGKYRLLFVLPSALYLIAIVHLLPTLFKKEHKVLGVAIVRMIPVYLIGTSGVLFFRLYPTISPKALPLTIIGTGILSYVGSLLYQKIKI